MNVLRYVAAAALGYMVARTSAAVIGLDQLAEDLAAMVHKWTPVLPYGGAA